MSSETITRTCLARAVCTCGQVLIERRYALVIVYRCVEFGVSSLKIAIRRILRMLSAPPFQARAHCTGQQWLRQCHVSIHGT